MLVLIGHTDALRFLRTEVLWALIVEEFLKYWNQFNVICIDKIEWMVVIGAKISSICHLIRSSLFIFSKFILRSLEQRIVWAHWIAVLSVILLHEFRLWEDGIFRLYVLLALQLREMRNLLWDQLIRKQLNDLTVGHMLVIMRVKHPKQRINITAGIACILNDNIHAKDQISELALVDYAIVVRVYLFEQLVELM